MLPRTIITNGIESRLWRLEEIAIFPSSSSPLFSYSLFHPLSTALPLCTSRRDPSPSAHRFASPANRKLQSRPRSPSLARKSNRAANSPLRRLKKSKLVAHPLVCFSRNRRAVLMAAVKTFADWAACVGHVMEFAGGRGVPVWEVWVGLSTYKVGMEGGQVSGGPPWLGVPRKEIRQQTVMLGNIVLYTGYRAQ